MDRERIRSESNGYGEQVSGLGGEITGMRKLGQKWQKPVRQGRNSVRWGEIVESNGASFAFPSTSVYVEKK